MAMMQDDGGLFGQSQMRRSMGAGAPAPTPFAEPKRNRQDPAPKGYGGSGLEDNGPVGAEVGYGNFGGAGGPMPIPDGGPGWRLNSGDQTGGGGGGPMPIPDRGDQNGGGGGPMPMPPPWGRHGNPEDYGVTMEFGGPGAINPPGMGPQDLRNLYNPPPAPPPFMEPKRNRQDPAPKSWGGSGLGDSLGYGNTGIVPPHLGGGLWDSVQGGGGPMPMPPKGGGGQSGYMGGPRINGGPYGPPHPQGGPATDVFGGGGGPMPMGPGRGLWGQGGQRGQFPQNIDPNLLRYLLMRRG